MWKLLLIIIITEALVEFISKSDLLHKFRQDLSESNWYILRFFGDAITCPYCCSFWVSMFWLIVFNNITYINFIHNSVLNYIFNFVISMLLVQRLSNYLHGIFDRFFSTRKDVRYTADNRIDNYEI